mmetsp:Transcript_19462/g.40954  ORF Transcript_19462/g.40954 Transcript_19462/m.40954 type:complete len:350 (-) Transcript_19462:126-1175(-)
MVNIFDMQTVLLSTTIAVMIATNVNAEIKQNDNLIFRDYPPQESKRLLQSIQYGEADGKALQAQNAPKEINVDPRTTYNDKFMALMNSPCRPEYDGFFGATSGESVRIQYGFQLEIQPLSSIMEIINIVEDKIVDSVLQSSFPEICGLHRTRKIESSENDPERSLVHVDEHPSGFRFLEFEEVTKCIPQVNDINFCGIFTGVLYAYGKQRNEEETSRALMSYIKKVLDTSESHDLHPELAMITSVDEFSSIEGFDIYPSTAKQMNIVEGGGLSRLDTLLIIVSGLILLAIFYYYYIQWDERRRYNDRKTTSSNQSIGSERGVYIEDEFIDEDLEFDPYLNGGENNGTVH